MEVEEAQRGHGLTRAAERAESAALALLAAEEEAGRVYNRTRLVHRERSPSEASRGEGSGGEAYAGPYPRVVQARR